jgi:EpsI family protein
MMAEGDSGIPMHDGFAEAETFDESAAEAVDSQRAESRALRLPRGLVLSILVLFGLSYRSLLLWDPADPLIPRTEGWFFLASNTSPQLVYAIAAMLLYRRRARILEALQPRSAPGAAIPLLCVGFALFLWGTFVGAPDLVLFSLMFSTLGGALLVYGRQFARALLLPVLFLAFAMPAPAVLTNQIVFPVQLTTAVHAAWVLQTLGIPVAQEGDMLYLADRTFEVIETCSGLRSMEVLLMLAVACLSFFPASRVHAVLLLAAAPLIAYLMNLVRVLSLILNPGSEVATLHNVQGAAVFLVGAILLFAVDSLLRRGFPRTLARAEDGEGPKGPGEATLASLRRRALAIVIMLAILLAASFWTPRWNPGAGKSPRAINLPNNLAGFRTTEILWHDLPFLWTVRYSSHAYRRYELGRQSVDVFVGYDDRLNRSQSLISPKNVFPGRGWHVEERRSIELEPGGLQAEEVVARSGGARILSYTAYAGTRGNAREIARAWLALDRSFLRRAGGAVVVRVSTEVEPATGGRARAEARVRRVIDAVRPAMSTLAEPT